MPPRKAPKKASPPPVVPFTMQTRGSTRTRERAGAGGAEAKKSENEASGTRMASKRAGVGEVAAGDGTAATTPAKVPRQRSKTPPSTSKKETTPKSNPMPRPRTSKGRVSKLKQKGPERKSTKMTATPTATATVPLPPKRSSNFTQSNPGQRSTVVTTASSSSAAAAMQPSSSAGTNVIYSQSQSLPQPPTVSGPIVGQHQSSASNQAAVITFHHGPSATNSPYRTMHRQLVHRLNQLKQKGRSHKSNHGGATAKAGALTQLPGTSSRPRASASSLTATSSTSTPSQPTTDLVKFPLPAVTAAPPRPPKFQEHLERTLTSLSTYKTFPVGKSSKEFQTVAQLMLPFEITSVEQIANPDLWQRFINARKEMLRVKSNDTNLLLELFAGDKEVLKGLFHSKKFNMDPLLATAPAKYSPNEALLFHCTRDRDNLERILTQGLDERLSSDKNSLFGKGIYFSDNPLKSVQYDGTDGTILIFRVLLGDCLSVKYDPAAKSSVREPEKVGDQKRSFNDHFFDSITAHAVVGRNEYVIFNRHQCCPLYLVKYKKDDGGGRQNYGAPCYANARGYCPAIAWKPHNYRVCSMPNQALDGRWPFYASSIFKEMVIDPDTAADAKSSVQKSGQPQPSTSSGSRSAKEESAKSTGKQECPICYNEYGAFINSPHLWKKLSCDHKLCSNCYQNIEKSGITMSGIAHTFVKCPFCYNRTGTEVGDCPDGSMAVKIIPHMCDGFRCIHTIQIDYVINDGHYYTRRIAYLPDNCLGNQVLDLLRTAWDRRLCFVIGDSITTGAKNVPVWNIHHKTNLKGGAQNYGYPDPGYFDRVKAELKAVGIE